MDAFSSYNQILMKKENHYKIAFVTSQGLYCNKVIPFGLRNVGVMYWRLANQMFRKKIGRNSKVYVDNMLVKSKEAKTDLEDLQALRRYRMKLNPTMCVFGVSLGKFLDFMVS